MNEKQLSNLCQEQKKAIEGYNPVESRETNDKKATRLLNQLNALGLREKGQSVFPNEEQENGIRVTLETYSPDDGMVYRSYILSLKDGEKVATIGEGNGVNYFSFEPGVKNNFKDKLADVVECIVKR